MRSMLLVTTSLLLFGGSALSGERAPCKRMVLVLVDASGSFQDHRLAAVEETWRLLQEMEPGECFAARAIGAESFGSNNDLVPMLELPPARGSMDLATRQRAARVKKAAVADLRRFLELAPARRTDFWQALYAAAFTFRTESPEAKELHVMTDLLDTRGLRGNVELDLAGVEASLLVPRRAVDDAQSFESRVATWTKILQDAGAADVKLDELSGRSSGRGSAR